MDPDPPDAQHFHRYITLEERWGGGSADTFNRRHCDGDSRQDRLETDRITARSRKHFHTVCVKNCCEEFDAKRLHAGGVVSTTVRRLGFKSQLGHACVEFSSWI